MLMKLKCQFIKQVLKRYLKSSKGGLLPKLWLFLLSNVHNVIARNLIKIYFPRNDATGHVAMCKTEWRLDISLSFTLLIQNFPGFSSPRNPDRENESSNTCRWLWNKVTSANFIETEASCWILQQTYGNAPDRSLGTGKLWL